MIVVERRSRLGFRCTQAFAPIPAIIAHGLGVGVLVQAIVQASATATVVDSQPDAANHRSNRNGVRGPGDFQRQLPGFCLDPFLRHQPIDEPEIQGFFSRQGLSQQQEFRRAGAAQLARVLEKVQGAHPGGNPELAKGKSQDRQVPRGSDPHVAGQRQAGPGPDRGSVEGADDGNGDLFPEAQETPVEAQHRIDVGVDGILRQGVEPPEIATGREGLVALAAQDDRANVLAAVLGVAIGFREVIFQSGYQGSKFVSHFYRQGIVGFW